MGKAIEFGLVNVLQKYGVDWRQVWLSASEVLVKIFRQIACLQEVPQGSKLGPISFSSFQDVLNERYHNRTGDTGV